MKRSCRHGLVAFALLGGMQSAAADVISDWNDIGFIVDRYANLDTSSLMVAAATAAASLLAPTTTALIDVPVEVLT